MASAHIAELAIPASSSKQMLTIDPYVEDVDELYQTIRSLAGPIVAAELRRRRTGAVMPDRDFSLPNGFGPRLPPLVQCSGCHAAVPLKSSELHLYWHLDTDRAIYTAGQTEEGTA
jgi:hypothetical protein